MSDGATSFDAARRPQPGDFHEYFTGYVGCVPDGSILETLELEGARAVALFESLDEPVSRHRYAAGKWSVREVVAHVSDAERVFAYRALRFGRGDATPLPGFEQDDWAPHTHADSRRWTDLIDELRVVRAATLHVLRSLESADWERRGVASGAPVTVRALAWIAAGHELHHRRILIERYGLRPPWS